MKYLLTILTLTLISASAFSQTKISGKITDREKQPLPGANIYLKDTYKIKHKPNPPKTK